MKKYDFTKVNLRTLTKLGACKDGKKWFLKNIGELDVSKIKDIEGDYNGYVEWLKYKFLGNKKFDENGNEIYCEDLFGYWIKREYDENGNEIHYEDYDGYWEKREYDENGNEIYYEDSKEVITRTYTTTKTEFIQTRNGEIEVRVKF